MFGVLEHPDYNPTWQPLALARVESLTEWHPARRFMRDFNASGTPFAMLFPPEVGFRNLLA